MAPFPTINARLWLHLDCDADWFVAGWRRTSFHGLKTTGRKVHLLAAALAACQLWRVTGIKRFGAWPLCTSSWWISTLSQAGENILRISRGSEALHVVLGALQRGSDVCSPVANRAWNTLPNTRKNRVISESYFSSIIPRVASLAIFPRLSETSGQDACFEMSKTAWSGTPGTASASPPLGLSIDLNSSGESRCSVG